MGKPISPEINKIHETYTQLTEKVRESIKSSIKRKHPNNDSAEIDPKVNDLFKNLETGATNGIPARRKYEVHRRSVPEDIRQVTTAEPLNLVWDILEKNDLLNEVGGLADVALWKAAFHTENLKIRTKRVEHNHSNRRIQYILRFLEIDSDSRYSVISALLMLEQSAKDLAQKKLSTAAEEIGKDGHSFGSPNSTLEETLDSAKRNINALYLGNSRPEIGRSSLDIKNLGVNDCMQSIIKTRKILGLFIKNNFPELKDDDDRRMLYGVIANFTFLKRSKLSGSQLSSLDSELIDSLRSKNYKKAEDALKSFIAENPEASTFGTYREAPYLQAQDNE